MLGPQVSKGQLLLVRVLSSFFRMFALDTRSLALFRVWIAATTIYDVLTRFPDAHHHYSDAGIFPREFVLRSFTNYYWITLHMLSGSEVVVQILFIVEILVAFLMLIGYKTRIMTILSWIMVCSVQNRNYVLGHSGDTVHRLFLFSAIFLPLSRCFSVDRALECARTGRDTEELDREREREKRRMGFGGGASSGKFEVVNFCTAFYTIQLLVMYYMAHHHKTGKEWTEKGIAAWMALQLDYFRTWFGDLLLIWTPGLIFGNYAVLKWQYWGSVIYFKALTCLGFFTMHLGFGMAFYLETFTWATLAAVSGLTPGWVWDLALKYVPNFPPFSRSITIHVVPNCATCMKMARILDEFMLPGRSKIHVASSLPPSSNPCACGSKCNWSDSFFIGISVTDQQKNMIHGPAALAAIAKSSPILYPLHYVLRAAWMRRALQFASKTWHSHPINISHDLSSLEEAIISESKLSYRPHSSHPSNDQLMVGGDSVSLHQHSHVHHVHNNGYGNKSSTLVDNYGSGKDKKDDDLVVAVGNDGYIGVVVDPLGKKEVFEDQSHTFTLNDVKEATKIGAKAAKEVFMALLLFLIIACNSGNVSRYGVPGGLQPVLWVFQLDQYWGMFAPRPPGYLDDGTHVELFNNGAMHTFVPNIPHTFDKPDIHLSIGNHRWFKLFENGLNSHSQREDIRLYFGRWFCREYNARHHGTQRIYKYSIHFMYERLDMEKMDGSRFPPAKETIWNHLCYEK